MPRLPRYYRQVRPIPSAGNAIIPSDAGQAVLREQADAGRALTQFGANVFRQLEEAEFQDQYNQAVVEAKKQMGDYELSLAGNTDFQSYDKGADEVSLKINETASKILTNKRAKQAFDRWNNETKTAFKQSIQWTRVREQGKFIENNYHQRRDFYVKTGDKEGVIKNAHDYGAFQIKQGVDPATLTAANFMEATEPVPGKEGYYADLLSDLGTIQENRQKAQEEAAKQAQNGAKDAIRGQIKETLQSSETWKNEKRFTKDDRRAAYEMVSEKLKPFIENGTFTKGEAFDIEKDLNNDVDNYAAEFTKAEKEAEKATIIETTVDTADKLATGSFTYDDYLISKLPKTNESKDHWNAVLEGSRSDPPPESSYDGHNKMLNILEMRSSGQYGEAESLDQLITMRFIDKSIKHEDYVFAVERVKNPYPKYVSDTIKSVTTGAENKLYHQGIGFLGNDWLDKKEQESLVRKNTAFMSWLESESQDGKYPSGEAMYKKMRELGVMIDTPKNLPKAPVIAKPTPQQSDPLYVTTDEDFASIPVGTEFYSSLLGEWVTKEGEIENDTNFEPRPMGTK